MLTDPSGAVIVAGTATLPGLPVTTDAFLSDYNHPASCGSRVGPDFYPCTDVYFAKIAPDGTLLFATYLGDAFSDTLIGAATNRAGDVYLLGATRGDAFSIPLDGPADSPYFLVKLNGSSVAFGKKLAVGGLPFRLAVDRDGNIYLAGAAAGGGLSTTPGVLQPEAPGKFAGFVEKLSPAADRTLYATYLGGSGFDTIADMTVDDSGNAYVTGSTTSRDFPVTPGAWQQVAPSTILQSSIFVSILNPSGTTLIASSLFGGESGDTARAMALFPTGEVLVAGDSRSLHFPVTDGAFQVAKRNITFPGSSTVFVVKLAPDLSHPVFSTYLSGESDEHIIGILAASDGSAIITGNTSSRFFPVTPKGLDRCNRTLAGTLDAAYVTHLSSDGSRLLYSSFFNADDTSTRLAGAAFTPDGRVLLAGTANLSGSNETYDLSYYGGPQIATTKPVNFVFRLDPESAPPRQRFCVMNAASFTSGFLVPGELITLSGTNIGPAEPIQAQPGPDGVYPNKLGGTRILIDGLPAALIYAGGDQVNASVPQFNLMDTSKRVDVEVDGVIIEGIKLRTIGALPGIFHDYGSTNVSAYNEDGSKNSSQHPAQRGSLVKLYGTGFGLEPAQFFFDSLAAGVFFQGQAPSGPPGLVEIDVRVPDSGPELKLVTINFSIGFQYQLGLVTIWVE